MSENPYESPGNPSQPRKRHVNERALDKKLRPWVLCGMFIAICSPFLALPFLEASKPAFGVIGLFYGLGVGTVIICYLLAKAVLIQNAPSLPEEDETDWLPH